MRSLFYRWMKTLSERDITNFVKLYSDNCIVFTKLKTTPIYNSPHNNDQSEEIFRGKIGSFRNFENILFSDLDDFRITEFSLDISERDKRIISKYDFIFKEESFKSSNIMILSGNMSNWEICYHQSILSK